MLDGELVAVDGGRVSFTALQQRLTAGRGLAAAISTAAAQLVVFDVLAAGGRDVRPLPLDERRELLEAVLADAPASVVVAEQSRDPGVADEWMRSWATAGVGIEGVVVKCGTAPYPVRAGQRVWHKVKARRTLDLLAVAILGPPDRPTGLVLANIDGRVVGDTTYLDRATAATVARLVALNGETGLRRPFWSGAQLVEVHGIDPMPVEVSADTAIDDGRLRHPVRLLRARPDLEARYIA